jgi:glycosyltransferase involved in cell wall biosynthesis
VGLSLALRAGRRSSLRLLIVIPALNEEEALRALVDEVLRVAATLPCSSEVVVVDDGSTDATVQVAAERGVRVVCLCRNLGIGGAVQTGLRLAYREGFDCAVQVDGDGQHPPSEIHRLVARLSQPDLPDIVVGSRRLEQRGYQSTPARRLGQNWLRLWLRAVCGLRVTDPTSGFRLYGARALALFQRVYPYDFPEPESLAVARARGLRLVDQPVEMRPRQGGRSSIAGLQPLYYMIKVTLAVALAYARNRGRKVAVSLDGLRPSLAAVGRAGGGSADRD